MSKIFVNENPQGQTPSAPSVAQPRADLGPDPAKAVTILFLLAIACGVCVLLYHYWKFALAVLLAMAVFACWSSRVALIGFMCVLLVVLAILGNSARAQTVVVGAEEQARRENLGVHAHECQPAWEWRAAQEGR
jgi:hypothetical protein